MYWKVMKLKIEVHLIFKDSIEGKIQFLFIYLTGVFAPIQQTDFLSQVFINDVVIAWLHEIELAPDAMH